MKNIYIGTNKYTIPQALTELNLKQLTKLMVAQQYLSKCEAAQWRTEIEATKLAIFFLLAPIKKKHWEQLIASQKQALINLVRWAFKATPVDKPFESFNYQGITYFLPAPSFSDTSAIELAICNIYYQAYTRKVNPQEAMLFKIVATICRPQRADFQAFQANPAIYNGDRREVYNGTLADDRTSLFEKMPLGISIAIFHYWQSMNASFVKRNEELFQDDGSAQLFHNGEGWLSMLEDIAKDGPLGDFDKVCATPVANVFMYLRHTQKKIEKLEREAARNQPSE